MSTQSPGDSSHERAAGDPSAGGTSAGDPSAGDTSAGDTSAGSTFAGDTSAGSTTTVRWWLRLQLGLGLGGGVVWFAGALLDSDFFTGLGAGLLIAALTLRFGRRSAAGGPDERP